MIFKRVSWKFWLTFLVLYLLLGFINISQHEMWRDELHIWAVCKSSNSIGELLFNKRYDGVPPLWYLICYVLTLLTDNPNSMKIIHLMFSSATAYLILRFSPFTWFNKVLLIFGYFFVYEYTVIARPYAPGIFFFFTAFIVYLKKQYEI